MTKSCLFVILLILASFFAVAAQSETLKNDLGNSFRNVSVVRLNKDLAQRQAQASRTFSITTANRTFELSLMPRDLRAARYYAEDTGVVGRRRLEKTSVSTYKGKIAGDAESEVRLTIDDAGIEGFFGSKRDRYFIEPAKKYSDAASADEFVVYQEADVLADKSIYCPQDLTGEIEDGKSMVSTENVQTTSGLKAIEVATEADLDFVNGEGGITAANAKILSILNMVEGVYESELNLTISVVYQHTWSVADNFDTATPVVRSGRNCNDPANPFASKVLCNLQDWWESNLPSTQIPRDTVHYFSNKSSLQGRGYAYLGVLCRNSTFAYGFTGNVPGWDQADFMLTAHEIGHNLGATHSDALPNCGNTLMQTQLSGETQFSFCSASRSEVSGFVSTNGICLTGRNFGRYDFDGDGKTDIGIFRPSAGEWWINRSGTSQTTAARFGVSSDKVASGDFTGDGKTDIAFFRPSNGFWFILRSEDSSFFSFPFGTLGDIPVPSDYDGDGRTDAAVFRPSSNTWFILQSGGGTSIGQFGIAGDVPVTADYDGDGKTDIAIFRPSVGEWWINKSGGGTNAFQFGNGADKPVQGDYTGDGKADIAIFRPSTGYWFILRSEDSSFYSVPYGTIGDIPSPGDYDGDGKFDTAVFRPSSNTWYINRTTAGSSIVTFGAAGDTPIPNDLVP
jgi:hypothetical protein